MNPTLEALQRSILGSISDDWSKGKNTQSQNYDSSTGFGAGKALTKGGNGTKNGSPLDKGGANPEEESEMEKWLREFEAAHGYTPDNDPELAAKGLSPEESIREHLQAKKWGEGFAQGFGRAPTQDEYRFSQPRRYVNGELVSGFGGYPPEEIERLQNGSGGGDGGPNELRRNATGARPVSFRQAPQQRYIQPAPKSRG